jgi:DNA repair photolyase
MRHGSKLDPPNRFLSVHAEADVDHLAWDDEYLNDNRRIEYIEDLSQSIIAENHSPDVPFRYSLNPYRGCAHGCAYCYARNTHEYLGWNAGLDFETKILVKPDAASLFREFLARPSYRPEAITFSGVTDCYQPIERKLRLTRQCLEVALECRQPVSIISKNALVVRDLDLLQSMAELRLIHVYLSVTSLDEELARAMEPRTSTPSARLRAVSLLAEAGIPVGVMTAPVIPGLNDSEIPALLKAAREAGAGWAGYVLLRLPLTVRPVFEEWLRRTQGAKADRVEGLIRQTRGGQMNNSRWGERMSGAGEIAEQIRNLHDLFRRKLGLDARLPPHDCSQFRRPKPTSRQITLF